MANNPWLKTWKLHKVDKSVSPLALQSTIAWKNKFRLVTRTGPVKCYQVKFKRGAMTKYWKNVVLVQRGKAQPKFSPEVQQALKSLKATSTPDEIAKVSHKVTDEIDAKDLVNPTRLECDIELPIGKRGRMVLGSLQLFQFPNTLGTEALLVLLLKTDAKPGGTGGGGSVRD